MEERKVRQGLVFWALVAGYGLGLTSGFATAALFPSGPAPLLFGALLGALIIVGAIYGNEREKNAA